MSKRRTPQVEEGADEWIVSFSDIMTLLLCFFVLLYAFSTIDAEKWKQIVLSFNSEAAIVDMGEQTPNSLINIPQKTMGIDSAIIENIDEQIVKESEQETKQAGGKDGEDVTFETLYEEIVKYTKERELDADIEVIKNDEEIILRLSNSIMFDSAKATLDRQATQILTEIISLIQKYDPIIHTVRIEGNTDSRPIYSFKYKDNYELSMQRALVVLRLFNKQHACSPEKLVAIGYGEYKPIATNDTPEGQAKNRRTDIILIENTSTK